MKDLGFYWRQWIAKHDATKSKKIHSLMTKMIVHSRSVLPYIVNFTTIKINKFRGSRNLCFLYNVFSFNTVVRINKFAYMHLCELNEVTIQLVEDEVSFFPLITLNYLMKDFLMMQQTKHCRNLAWDNNIFLIIITSSFIVHKT